MPVSPTARRGSAKLNSVQALRAFAACLVVFFHLWSDGPSSLTHTLHRVAYAGYCGVDVFFVLSGFIIFYIHRRDLGRPDTARTFCRKRALRIFPMYLIVIATKCLLVYVPGFRDVRYSWDELLISASLFPISNAHPVLSVSWSLTFELFFYGLFLVGIFTSRRFLYVSLGIWVVAILLATRFSTVRAPALVELALSFRNLGFILGILVAWILGRGAPSKQTSIAATLIGTLVFVGSVAAVDLVASVDSMPLVLRNFSFAVGGALLLYGLVGWERNSNFEVPRFLVFVGDASYSIYLTHVFLGSTLRTLLRKVHIGDASLLFPILVSCGAVAFGCLVYVAVERPLLARLRHFS